MSANAVGVIFLILALPAGITHHAWEAAKNRKIVAPGEELGPTMLKLYDGAVVLAFLLISVGFFRQGGLI